MRQFAVFDFLFEVARFIDDDFSHQQKRNQVGQCHQAVERIRSQPHQIKAQHGTQHDGRDVTHAVQSGKAFAENVHRAFLAVITPAENG